MPNVAIIARAATMVPSLMQVHGWPDDTLTMTSETGGEPLESGLDVTDHIRVRQDQLTLQGIVSDFDGIDRTHAAIAELREVHRRGEPIEVITEDARWPEMVIKRAQVVKQGRGREVRLDLEEVIRVSVGTLPELTPQTSSGPAENRGGAVNRGRVPLGD